MHFHLKTCAYTAIFTALLLSRVTHTQAQDVTTQYTVYGSVIYARTGEHTPAFKLASETYRLTPYGAQQMINLV
jgi:hypothetical protein